MVAASYPYFVLSLVVYSTSAVYATTLIVTHFWKLNKHASKTSEQSCCFINGICHHSSDANGTSSSTMNNDKKGRAASVTAVTPVGSTTLANTKSSSMTASTSSHQRKTNHHHRSSLLKRDLHRIVNSFGTTVTVLVLWVLTLNGVLLRAIHYRQICQVMLTSFIVLWGFSQMTMYCVFVARVFLTYARTKYRYRVRTAMALYTFSLASITAVDTMAILTRQFQVKTVKWHHKIKICEIHYPILVFGLIFAYNLVFSLVFLYMFTQPLFHMFGQRDRLHRLSPAVQSVVASVRPPSLNLNDSNQRSNSAPQQKAPVLASSLSSNSIAVSIGLSPSDINVNPITPAARENPATTSLTVGTPDMGIISEDECNELDNIQDLKMPSVKNDSVYLSVTPSHMRSTELVTSDSIDRANTPNSHTVGLSSVSSNEDIAVIAGGTETRKLKGDPNLKSDRIDSVDKLKEKQLLLLPLKYTVIVIITIVTTFLTFILISLTQLGIWMGMQTTVILTCLLFMTNLWIDEFWLVCSPLMRLLNYFRVIPNPDRRHDLSLVLDYYSSKSSTFCECIH